MPNRTANRDSLSGVVPRASALAALVLLVFAAAPTPSLAAPPQPLLPGADARYALGDPDGPEAAQEWWRTLQDPALDDLIVEALQANPDVAAAQARIKQAQAVTMQNASPLLPSVSFDVNMAGSPTDAATFQIPPQFASGGGGTAQLAEDFYRTLAVLRASFPQAADALPEVPEFDEEEPEDPPKVTWNGSAMLNFGLNIDLGRSAMALRAAQLDALAARGDRGGVARVVVQQVVASWLDVRTARSRVSIVQQQIETNTQLLELTRRRYEGGQAGGLDVLQQQQQLASTRSLLPPAEQLLRLREAQLATLLGRDPAAPGLPAGEGLPPLPEQPAVGRPRDLLTARPDLAAARIRLESAKARVTSAALNLAPTFRVGGNAGWNMRWFNEWDSVENWGVSAGVSIPIFNGLQRHGALQQAIAARNAASFSLESATRTAQTEVETSLAREQTEVGRLDALGDQLQTARVAYEEASRQYASGLANYLTVLTSLASLQAAELNHLQAQRDLLGARVDLHTALGATWSSRLDGN